MNIETVHGDVARVGSQLPGDKLEQCGFARAARAHDCGDFPPLNFDVDAIENQALTAIEM